MSIEPEHPALQRVPVWRIALVGDLTLLSLAVSAFAWVPLFAPEPGALLNPVTRQEAFIAAAGILVAAGLMSNLFPFRVPGARWAYLGSSVLALVTAALFFLSPPFYLEPGVGLVIGLVLASNVVGGAAAHLVDGGGDKPRKGRSHDRPLRR